MMRWNVSSRATELSGADAYVISIPKSGRTWMRTFLSAYFCKLSGSEFFLDPPRDEQRGIPRVVFTHDFFENRTKGSWWDQFRGKYLVPSRDLISAKIILLARDPRDTIVSLHAHLTRRAPDAPAKVKRMSLHELLRDSRFGAEAIIQAMNEWMTEFGGDDKFALVRYEAMRQDPATEFRRLLHFLTTVPPDENAFAHALSFADFDNMKKLEGAGAFTSEILQPANRNDPESYKVRRGQVGGFRDHLSGEDLRFVETAMQELDPRFRYIA